MDMDSFLCGICDDSVPGAPVSDLAPEGVELTTGGACTHPSCADKAACEGPVVIEHDGHKGWLLDGRLHCMVSGSDTPTECTLTHELEGSPRARLIPMSNHVHGPSCGHRRVPHQSHFDYLVGDELHHVHEGCCGHTTTSSMYNVVHHGKAGKILEKNDAAHQQRLAQQLKGAKSKQSEDPTQAQPQVNLVKTRMHVGGICCPSEEPIVMKICKRQPGVKSVTVVVPTKSVIVEHDPTLTNPGDLVDALNKAALKARLDLDMQMEIDKFEYPPLWIMIASFFFLIHLMYYLPNLEESGKYVAWDTAWNRLHPTAKWAAIGTFVSGLPPIMIKAGGSLRNGVLDINCLMTIAVAAAIGLGKFSEACAVIILFATSEWLEELAMRKARVAMGAILALKPQTAVLASTLQEVKVEEISIGTHIAIKPGEKVGVDGVVVKGTSSMDEAALTGESRPVSKSEGSEVYAGSINLTSYVEVETTTLAKDSAVAKLVALIEDTQSTRSRNEQLVNSFANYYTPAVVLLAVLYCVLPYFVFHHHEHLHRYIYTSTVLLVTACPCALVISTPVVTVCGLANAARMGVLIKGGLHLENLGKLKVMAFDKTGTVTEGKFVLSHLGVVEGRDPHTLLRVLAAVEAQSSHPIAAAILQHARARGLAVPSDVTEFAIVAGEGIQAEVEGKQVAIGSYAMAKRLGWFEGGSARELAGVATRLGDAGGTVSCVGMDGALLGVLCCEDAVRAGASDAIRQLEKLGLTCHLLTGDGVGAAHDVASKIGMSAANVQSLLKPEDKLAVIEGFKHSGPTAMIGDGINDAPALAAADVGIAMGVMGTAVAMETADVALFTNDLSRVCASIELGRRCRTKIIINVVFSIAVKIVVFGFTLARMAGLWQAMLADVGSAMIVICNGMSILEVANDSSHASSKPAKARGVIANVKHRIRKAQALPRPVPTDAFSSGFAGACMPCDDGMSYGAFVDEPDVEIVCQPIEPSPA